MFKHGMTDNQREVVRAIYFGAIALMVANEISRGINPHAVAKLSPQAAADATKSALARSVAHALGEKVD